MYIHIASMYLFVLGTECRVLDSRRNDDDSDGLNRWTFTILAFWGEIPTGNFVIDIFDTVHLILFYNKF